MEPIKEEKGYCTSPNNFTMVTPVTGSCCSGSSEEKVNKKDGESACCEPTKSPIWMTFLLYTTVIAAISILIYKLFI